jgi:hypothetical protein
MKAKDAHKKGLSVALVLILMAVATLIIFILKEGLNFSFKTQRARSTSFEWRNLIESVRVQLENPLHCKRILGGPSSPGQSILVGNNQISEVELHMPYAGVPSPLRQNWSDPLKHVQIKNIKLVIRGNAPIRQVRLDKPNSLMATWNAELYSIGDEKSQAAGLPNPNKARNRIFLDVNVTPANAVSGSVNIVSCHGRNSHAALCEMNGGAFDSFDPPTYPTSDYPHIETRCHPHLQCHYSNQGLLDSATLCKPPYKPSSVGYLNGIEKFLCQWCNSFKPATGP